VLIGDRPYRANETPVEDALIPEITFDSMPCSWPRMWNNTTAKKRMYDILADLLRGIIVKGVKSSADTQYIIHDMHGAVWTNFDFPGGAESTMPPIK